MPQLKIRASVVRSHLEAIAPDNTRTTCCCLHCLGSHQACLEPAAGQLHLSHTPCTARACSPCARNIWKQLLQTTHAPPAAFDSRRHPRLPPTCMDACPHPRSCALRPLEGPFRAVCTKGHIRLPAANAWLRDRESRLRGEHGRACFFLSSLSLWPPAIAAYGPMSSELYLLHCAHERTLCAQLAGRKPTLAPRAACMPWQGNV